MSARPGIGQNLAGKDLCPESDSVALNRTWRGRGSASRPGRVSSVAVEVLHRLSDEGMGDERPASELRVSEIEAGIEDRNFDPVPVEVAARDFARG